MNTDLRKKSKNDFYKAQYKLMSNSALGKSMENVRKSRNIKLVTTERKGNYLAWEPNYHITKKSLENLLVVEMKKKKKWKYKWIKQFI